MKFVRETSRVTSLDKLSIVPGFDRPRAARRLWKLLRASETAEANGFVAMKPRGESAREIGESMVECEEEMDKDEPVGTDAEDALGQQGPRSASATATAFGCGRATAWQHDRKRTRCELSPGRCLVRAPGAREELLGSVRGREVEEEEDVVVVMSSCGQCSKICGSQITSSGRDKTELRGCPAGAAR